MRNIAALEGRHERGEWRDALGRASLTVYDRRLAGQTVAAHVASVSSTRPDSADWLYLGGRDGLRGYVDHFLAGDRRVSMTIEDRIITAWRPLGLLQAGFVAYLDAGVVRRADTARWSRTYANVGGGLRFGLPKSPRDELLQLSIAAPLVREPGVDRLVVVFGNRLTF
jgi:hemolysin activation/secretion protein